MINVRKSFTFELSDVEPMFLFPFDKIKKESSILIYGAGQVGQIFFNQVKRTKYCDVLAMIDKDWDKFICNNWGIDIICPEKMTEYEFDSIVIALDDDKQREEVKEYLITGLKIESKKIISQKYKINFDFTPKIYKYRKVKNFAFNNKSNDLTIAFYAGGGMGDIIIEKKLIAYILNIINGSFKVDIYGDLKFTKTILYDCRNINEYYPEYLYSYNKDKYDLAINTLYIMSVDAAKYESMLPSNTQLCNVIKHLDRQLEIYNLPASNNFELNSIHFARCRYLKRNAYNAYSEVGGLEIENSSVTIPIDGKYENKYKKLQLKRYLTIHYGWGGYVYNLKISAKMWPNHYFARLIRLIKERYEGIEVIQLGEKSDLKIDGVDRYILGENLELVKYILCDSLIHIGNDGGLVHLATQLGTKCAVVFGPTPEWYFGYSQNINIVAETCNSCYFLLRDAAKCVRGLEQPECMLSIKPETVFDRIQPYMDTLQQ